MSKYRRRIWAGLYYLLIATSVHAQDVGDGSVSGDLNTNVGAGATVDSNNSSETVNYNGAGSAPGSQPASTAMAPTVMGGGGNDSCLIPVSTGLQVSLFGTAIGTAEQDPECNRRKDARLLGTPQPNGGLGLQVAGISLMCQSPQVFRAMALASTPCPIVDVVSGKILIGREAYERMREEPATYIVGYYQDRSFWDTVLYIGEELPDAPPEPKPTSLSDRFRRTTRPGGNDYAEPADNSGSDRTTVE